MMKRCVLKTARKERKDTPPGLDEQINADLISPVEQPPERKNKKKKTLLLLHFHHGVFFSCLFFLGCFFCPPPPPTRRQSRPWVKLLTAARRSEPVNRGLMLQPITVRPVNKQRCRREKRCESEANFGSRSRSGVV